MNNLLEALRFRVTELLGRLPEDGTLFGKKRESISLAKTCPIVTTNPYTINPIDYIAPARKIFRQNRLSFNLRNPRTIQEKLAWLNFYEPSVLKTRCADKILLHGYCKEMIGKDLCIPLIKIYDSTSEINWDELPRQFVIKCNHGSGMNIIVDNKATADQGEIMSRLDKWMGEDFAFRNGFELHYHDIQHKIFVEEYKNDGHKDLIDYKFLCFNGIPTFLQVIGGRNESSRHLNYYDMNFSFVRICRNDFPNNERIKDDKPESFEQMKEFAIKLSSPFKFVRVDFYEIGGKVYLGELTFTPGAMLFKYETTSDNVRVGDLLHL